jgi:hypothetical protein
MIAIPDISPNIEYPDDSEKDSEQKEDIIEEAQPSEDA